MSRALHRRGLLRGTVVHLVPTTPGLGDVYVALCGTQPRSPVGWVEVQGRQRVCRGCMRRRRRDDYVIRVTP